jgi:uncharacterized membrane protein
VPGTDDTPVITLNGWMLLYGACLSLDCAPAQRGHRAGAEQSAERAFVILHKRYARGAISKEECPDMRPVLQNRA